MKTKDQLFLIFFIFFVGLLGGCSNLTQRREVKPAPQATVTAPGAVPVPNPTPTPHVVVVLPTPVPTPIFNETVTPPEVGTPAPILHIPKFGVILGPGQFKAFAHIGVLQELIKAKAPIQGVVGLEWGALIGGVYSQKGLVNEVEWQISKLHEEELLKKGLLASTFKSRSVHDLLPFIKSFFGASRIENTKIPFACPVYDMEVQKLNWIDKGTFDPQFLNCLLAPPLWTPEADTMADMTAVREAADYLRSKGANVIVLVNVLGPRPTSKGMNLDLSSRPFWALVQKNVVLQYKNVDFVISVNTQDIHFTEVGKRRELIQKGREAVGKVLPQMASRFGL